MNNIYGLVTILHFLPMRNSPAYQTSRDIASKKYREQFQNWRKGMGYGMMKPYSD